MRPLSILALAFAITFAMACTKEVEVEVIKEVPVEIVKEIEVEKVVTKEVAVEVVKEVVVEKEVVKEVIVEVDVAAEAAAAAQASAAKPIEQPQSATPSGHIVIAVTDVPPGVGLGSAQLDDGFHYWGVGEATFQSIEGDTAAPMLATDYTLESDLSGGTLTIRDDVVFHGDWGPMTAADIAYTINDGNGAVNPRSIHWQAGDFAAMFGKNELTVIDDTTVGFTFQKLADGTPAFDPRWNANLLNDAGQAFSVQSTAVRDANGEDWMRDNPVIATGPFSVVEWKQDDVGIIQRVPYDHWLVNPEVETFTFREVAEEATKAALM